MFKKIADFFKKLIQPKQEIAPPKPLIPEPELVISGKALWYPKAVIQKRKMIGNGEYTQGYPQGAIVHFTAGQDRTEQDAIDTYDWGCDEGYVFFVIGPTGVVYQGFPLNIRGSHAGTSNWPGLGDSVSKYLVGIEVACAGELEDGKSWFGVHYPEEQIRFVEEKEWECPTGHYKKYTGAQEKSLIELILWLKRNNPDVFNLDYVLAHHEVAGKKGIGYWRKTDCGGSLSMPMTKFREYLKSHA